MLKKLLRSPLATIGLFVAAAVLIGFGGINTVRAAPAITSTWFGAQVELDDIDVALTERNDENADWRRVHDDKEPDNNSPLLTELIPDGKEFTIGRTYTEELGVLNTQNALNNNGVVDDGSRIIKEYVRVTVYKYWTRTNEQGETIKATDLDPAKIKLNFVEGNGWTIDRSAPGFGVDASREYGYNGGTGERTVVYYSSIVDPQGYTTNFTDTLTIDSSVLDEDKYKDATFHIKAVVDAVQTHNGSDAMMSAWGNNSMITVGADSEQ